MWSFTVDGFFSAVQKEKGGGVTVRARCKGDLTAMLARLGLDRAIVETPYNDYAA